MLEEALVKEDEQPYEVPENWEWVKLGTVSKINMGQSPKSTFVDNNPNNIPLIGGPKDMGEIFPNISRYTNKPTKLSDVGDLIITIRATLGKTNFSDRKYCLGRGVASLTPHKAEINYLKNYFTTIEGYLYEISTGTTFSQISKQDLVDLQFPLPPLPEQKRIVKKLSSMLGRLKEARELIQEARDTFEERRAPILNKAFTGELTKKWREENPDVESAEKLIEILISEKRKQRKEGKKGKIPTHEEMIIEDGVQPYNLPGNWEWVKIGCLLCEVAKKDPKKEGIEKFTYLDISSIDNKAGRITDPKTYKGIESPSRARQIVKTNDILFSTVRTYLKNIAVVDEIYNDQIASTGFCVMRCCGIINSRLLFRFVSSDVFIDQLNGFQRGISYPAVKTSDLLEQPIPLLPLPEQKEIVRILEKLLDHEDEARALIDMEEQIDLLEKSILSKAFRGELNTNDTNDEPAIELLKRSLKEKNE